MNYQHKELASGRWNALTFFEQMANIGSEVERSIKWRNEGRPDYYRLSFDRALELLDLTISDKRNVRRLKELARLREVLADYFEYDNQYGSDDKKWQKYFYCFNYAARLNK